MKTKKCAICQKTLPATQEHFSPTSHSPPTFHSYCKPCDRVRRRGLPKEKKARANQKRAEWVARQRPDYIKRKQERRRLAKYGLTQEAHQKILKLQAGACAVCGRTPEENGKALAIDHCHVTGIVRGLLCSRCNYVVGLIKETPGVALSLVAYLRGAEIMKKLALNGHDPLQIWLE